jgi:hypothetical protein
LSRANLAQLGIKTLGRSSNLVSHQADCFDRDAEFSRDKFYLMALLSQRKLGVNFLRFRLHDKYLKEVLSIVLDLVPSPSFSDILLREGTEQKRLTPESAAPGRVATAAPTRHVLAGAIFDAKAEQNGNHYVPACASTSHCKDFSGTCRGLSHRHFAK